MIDLVATIPLDLFFETVISPQILKSIKLTRIIKLMRVIKFTKI